MDNEKFFIELPSEAEVQAEIQMIMKRGLSTKSSFKKKRALLVAASFLGALLLLGFSFPGYASQIPVIGGVFELFDDGRRNFAPLQSVATTANVRITGNVEGMELNIESVVFDGRSIYISYQIISENSLANVYPWELLQFINNVDLRLDGRRQNSGRSSHVGTYFHNVAENTYASVANMTFFDIPTDAQSGRVDFAFGDWQVRLWFDRIQVDIVEVYETVGQADFSATITRVNSSPTGIAVHFEFALPTNIENLTTPLWIHQVAHSNEFADFNARFFDNFGNIISTGWSGTAGREGGHGAFMILPESIDPNATKIVFSPFMIITSYDLDNWAAYGHTCNGCFIRDIYYDIGRTIEVIEVPLGEIVIDLP